LRVVDDIVAAAWDEYYNDFTDCCFQPSY